MKKTLIQITEVINNATLNGNFDGKILKNQIWIAEQKHLADEKHGCFGRAMYKALVDDLVECVVYNSEDEYEVGDVVVFNDQHYKKIGVAGSEHPTDESAWEETGKFSTEAYNKLWSEGGLVELIANLVVGASIYKGAYQFTSSGVVVPDKDGVKSADTKGINLLRQDYTEDTGALWRAVLSYMTENKSDFEEFGWGEEESCGDGERGGKCGGSGSDLGVMGLRSGGWSGDEAY